MYIFDYVLFYVITFLKGEDMVWKIIYYYTIRDILGLNHLLPLHFLPYQQF